MNQVAATPPDEDWCALEDHVTPDGAFMPPSRPEGKGPHAKTQRFPCEACFGTGKWRGGRVNNSGSSQCFACGGNGYFLHSEQDRRNARHKAAARKAKKLADTRAAFDAQHPGIGHFLTVAATWSTFALQLSEKLAQYGALTDPQLRAVESMQAKCAAKHAERAVEREANKQTIDLAPIRAMFETARNSGHKRPVYRAAGLVISRASDTGRNPGALYVKTAEGDEYLGKIIGTEYAGKPAPALAAIAADPRGEAIRYGQRTGQCSCCGRELTAEASIDAGIGPVCASKWGL